MIDHNDTYGKEQAILTIIRACTKDSKGAWKDEVFAKAKALGFSTREYNDTLEAMLDKVVIYEPNAYRLKIFDD